MKKVEPTQDIRRFVGKEVRPAVQAYQMTSFFDRVKVLRYSLIAGAGFLCRGGLFLLEKPLGLSIRTSSLGSLLFLGLSLVAGAVALYYIFIGFRKKSLALHRLRREIKSNVLKFWDKGLDFKASATFPMKVYRSCGLFPSTHCDSAVAEDHIQGQSKATPFYMSEIHTREKKKYTDSKGRTRTRWVDIFKGILFVADFNKNFSGTTLVRTDALESKIGSWGRKFQRITTWGTSLNLVELESPEFEGHFQVKSSDPVEARYILSSTFMERILSLRSGFGPGVQLCFNESNVIITIPYRRNFLDANLNLKRIDDSVRKMIDELENFIAIIDVLQLNENIWNKENRKKVLVA